MPGTAYLLFHHVMGEAGGARGVWGYMRGGMGGVTQALAAAARDLDVDIRCDAEVARILVDGGRAVGVALASGDEYRASIVASNADAHVTFLRLLDRDTLPDAFVADVERISYASASVKINVALAELPSFRALPGTEAGPQHRGTIHISPDQDYIERAFDDAKYGRPSADPVLECTIPSTVDPTVAPPGRHLMSMFVQYAPYDPRGSSWDEQREAFADRSFDVLNDYAPNFKDAVLDRQVLAPLDLERVFNLTGGNIFQGAMTPGQLFAFRPRHRLRELPHAAPRPVPVRCRRPSRRRRDGNARAQCRTRDPASAPAPPARSSTSTVVTLQFSTAAQTTASTGSRATYALAIRIGPPEVTSAISSAGDSASSASRNAAIRS
jgi:phytoene dehydrogenase-like protein